MVLQDEQDLPEPGRSAFLISLLAKRKEAIRGRIDSGIEEEWLEDEEHYQGIDDANRAYLATAGVQAKRWATGDSGKDKNQNRSVVFLNITAPYVDSASAAVSDKLLPTDDRSWMIKPTPITTQMRLALMTQGTDPVEIDRMIDQAKASAAAMQDEIDDCLVESNWHGEVRQIIEDAARIGSGVLKGPYPHKTTARMWQTDPEGLRSLVTVSEIRPATRRIDPWLFWPDPSCGESVQHGSYTWELEYLSARQVRDLLDLPGYDAQAIRSALREGPNRSQQRQSGDGHYVKSDEQFELWIFHGTVDSDDLTQAGVEIEDETPKASAMALVLNDRLIKVALNVLDSGDFPYDVLAWQRRPGMPWGTGVGRKIRTVQRILVGGVRAMMDNAGLSAGVQLVIGNGITPSDGQWSISGRKLWRAETDVEDVRKSFFAFVPPSVQGQLMQIVQWAMRVAEDTTGMPAMLQGLRGDAPETLGGMQMAQNNSSSVLRRIAKRMDDYVTEPHITRYYDWMMQHSDREDIKGDFQVDVRASSALVERDAQQQFLMGLLQLSVNPEYNISPKRLMAELIKGQRMDPKRVQYSAEESAALQQSHNNPIEDAKAELLHAQALKTEAERATKNVEGMFSATSSANLIAQNPEIAPVADQIWASAGGSDANAPPAIPSVPPGVPSVQLPHNTSPAFPPNPDVGMDKGIETGSTQDGDEA